MGLKDYNRRLTSTSLDSKKTQEVNKNNKIKFILIGVIIVLIIVVGFLLIKKRSEKTVTKNTADIQSILLKNSHSILPTLPALPVKPWSYMSMLDSESVVVHVVKQYDLPSQPFLMQCGAYQTVGQAEYRKAMLALLGYSSQIRTTMWRDGLWYRVILGPYSYRRLGGQARAEMHRRGVEGCAVWQWTS